ncbi:MAG TPA: hypothetical protein VFS54_11120 [Solirubrobacterales bacterium]|nr:hypothetical protein [Solirubrobacterales bacterium]
MSRLRRPKLVLVAAAFAVLAVALSACATYKPESLKVSQPGGVGPVRVHFELCTEPGVGGCEANEDEGQAQYLLMFAVPQGTVPPPTITATPVGGGAPIVYSRNDQVAQSYDEAIASFSEALEQPFEWPPAGSVGVGYLSAVFTEEKGAVREWVVDANFGLPAGAGGGPYGGPFTFEMGSGWRAVSGSAPADRPVDCYEPSGGEPDEERDAFCTSNEEEPTKLGTSDLQIGAPAPASAFVGGKASIVFPLAFASTASPLPGFALSATSTLPKAKLALSNPAFAPGAPDLTTHLSPADSRGVTVSVPSNAKPGTYDVTVTAATPQGGTVSQVAKLKVTKPKLKLGGVKLNKAKGTATLTVKVPSAGTLTVAGKGVVKAKKKAKKAKKLKITIRAKGKAKAQLEELGKAKVKAKLSFKPTSGSAVKKSKGIALVLRPGAQ